MKPLMLVAVGFALLLVFLAVANMLNKRGGSGYVDGPRLFIWFWLVATLINTAFGIYLGYSLLAETIIFIIAFGAPAGVAWYVARMIKRREQAMAMKPPPVTPPTP